MKKIVLGKGLDALIGSADLKAAEKGSEVIMVEIAKISRSDYQPRQRFGDLALEELKKSIGEKGIIQPILIRKSGDRYQIVAGERRLRAAQSLGMEKIPALIKDIPKGEDILEISLIENIQREDLNPLEKARGYQRLMVEFGLTQEEVAGKVSIDRASVANTLRLLDLEDEIKSLIEEGKLSFGHARALLAILPGRSRIALAKRASQKGLSVREIESHVLKAKRAISRKEIRRGERDPHLEEAERKLRDVFKTKVNVYPIRRKKGTIEIEYFSLEDFDRIFNVIVRI